MKGITYLIQNNGGTIYARVVKEVQSTPEKTYIVRMMGNGWGSLHMLSESDILKNTSNGKDSNTDRNSD